MNLRCRKVSSHGLADPARLQEARARWLGELAMQESKLERLSRPRKVARGTSEVARRTGETRQGCKRRERGGSANLRCKKVNSNGLADPARLQEARARWLGELARKVSSHGLADPARLQEARARWLGELAMQESKLERLSRPRKVARGTSEVARRTGETRQGCKRRERGGSANLRCKKVNSNGLADPARLQEARARWLGELARKVSSHGLADPARLQEARARWLGELAMQESKLERLSRPRKVARGTSEVARRTGETRQGCKRRERGGSANLRCKKVNSNGLADPARLQEARARWLGELARKVSSHGLADPARLQEARARWLGELAMQESKLERLSRPRKVARGTSEVARRTGETRQGCKRRERGGSANLRCKKVNSNGLADPARLQEARARWLGELAMQESKLERLSRPRKVARGTSEVARRTCGAGNSHGLADPARMQEARARWFGELAVQESKLARVSKPGKVTRGTSDVARRTCGAGK
ncbi:hypothetical protein CRG98_039052 [Punica granatum]|uniref:Uncharacterized protein n=1 Tax=Punica granatum TaxID=22663 RepID=A0A2I0I992_PUNGR|nr:hypothetical protein CRG98_039052 [Punica granatum]